MIPSSRADFDRKMARGNAIAIYLSLLIIGLLLTTLFLVCLEG